MNHHTKLEIARIVERYIPGHHYNERRHLGQDMTSLVEHVYCSAISDYRFNINALPLWKRVWYALFPRG